MLAWEAFYPLSPLFGPVINMFLIGKAIISDVPSIALHHSSLWDSLSENHLLVYKWAKQFSKSWSKNQIQWHFLETTLYILRQSLHMYEFTELGTKGEISMWPSTPYSDLWFTQWQCGYDFLNVTLTHSQEHYKVSRESLWSRVLWDVFFLLFFTFT